ncbi:MAG: transposase [Candidatus Omnitrophota bacterium]
MPRLPRASLEGVLYYITSSAMPDNRLFGNPEDYRTYLTLLRNNQSKFKLFAFFLQPDQITLLLELKPQASLSHVMHTINNSYTKYYNSRYGETPHLFKGRYESKILERSYLLKTVDYIHSLCANCHSDPERREGEESLYSSYPIYLGQQGSIPIPEEMREVMNYLAPDEAYPEHLKKVTEEAERLGLLLNKKRIIGSREFIRTIREKIESSGKSRTEEGQTAFLDSRLLSAGMTERRHEGIRAPFPNLTLGSLHLDDGVLASSDGKGQMGRNPENKTANLPKRFVFGVTSLILLFAFIYPWYQSEKRMNLARTQIDLLQKELELAEKNLQLAQVPDYLDGSKWLVTLKSSSDTEAIKDEIIFHEKKVISKNLMEKGFSPTKYSISFKKNGLMVWESIQTNPDGQTVNWYGIYDGSTIKGVLSENIGGPGEKIFSFISIKKKLTESKNLMG